MKWLRGFLFRLGGLFRRERRERELAAEMESHLQMHIEDNLRSGMSHGAARREALMKLGGVEQTKEMVRERRGLPMLEVLLQDVRFGMRRLWEPTLSSADGFPMRTSPSRSSATTPGSVCSRAIVMS